MNASESPSGNAAENAFEQAECWWRDVAVLGACSLIVAAVHGYTGNGYGFHRDELQFLDDARHLQWGFVAYPPLTAFSGRLAIALFGISPQVFRLPAMLGNMLSLLLVGLTARELGGRRLAQLVALFAMLPVALAFSSVLQYNTFDLLAWSGLVFSAARMLRSGDGRWWLGAGASVGLGVLSKYSIAMPVAALLTALLLLPSQRHHVRSRWFWYGALLAGVIALPNLVWLARHDFITITMERTIHARDVRLGRAAGYYTDQLKFTLLALPLAVAGLIWLVRSRRFRLLSAFYLGPFVLFALVKGRGYYLLPGYTVLYAAGAVALEGMLAGRSRWARAAGYSAVFAALLANSAAIGWAYLPIWQPGSAAWRWQMANNGDMADEVGWPELVAEVAAVRDLLPAEDRQSLAVLAHNYGEAGALALYGGQYALPTPISSTNSFHSRGYGSFAPETVIVVGSTLPDQQRNFAQCRVAAEVRMPYDVRNEESVRHPQILVCHHLRRSWPEVWSRSQEFG